MRIWILNHYAEPIRATGNRHAVLANCLVQAGHEVTIFASAGRHAGGKEVAGVSIPDHCCFLDHIIDGVHWRFVRTRPFNDSLRRFLGMRDFRANACRATDDLSEPDVVIGSCVHPYAVDAAQRLAQRYGAPFVYEIRDVWPESLDDLGAVSRWHPIYWHFWNLNRRALKDAAGVVCLFPGLKTYLAARGIPRERLCVIPNGIDPSCYPNLPQPQRQRPFTLSYFGSHGRANGLHTVIEAAALLSRKPNGRNIRIRLVGDGGDKLSLMQRAEQLRLTNIVFCPPVTKREVSSLATETHGFIFCLRRMPVLARYGISPNKLCEYLAFGRPVIFSCKAYNNPVEEARAGISIPPEDPEAMARAMLRLSDLPEAQRMEMGQNGRDYAFMNYNLPRLSQRLDTFLQTITARAKQAGPHEVVASA